MKPTTISLLQKYKQEKKRFATITAYDYSFAKLFADEGLNVMLVGDSLGMTVQGHDSTLPVKTPQRLCVPVLTWSKLKAVSGW